MFDQVLNMSLPLDGYYLHGLSSLSRSRNNVVLYKIKIFIKKQYLMVQLEINWRKKLNP